MTTADSKNTNIPLPLSAKEIAVRTLLAVVGISVGFLVAEAVARIALPPGNWSPGAPFSTSGLVELKGGSFKTKPNLDTKLQFTWFPATRVITDDEGWRIPEERTPVPEDAKTVLFVGASFTWGFGVEAEDAWPFVLERMLAGSDHPIRVINAAQMGHTLPQMLAILEQWPDDRMPDAVVIALPMGGLYVLGMGSEFENTQVENTATALQNLNLGLDESGSVLEDVYGWMMRIDRRPKTAVTDWVQTHSVIGHRVIRRMAMLSAPQQIVERRGERDFDGMTKRCEAVGQRLNAAWRRFAEKKIPLALVIEPIHQNALDGALRDITPRDLEVLIAFKRASGMARNQPPSLDLARPEGNPDYLHLDSSAGGDFNDPIDMHYNPKGHKKVAERVAVFLKKLLTTPVVVESQPQSKPKPKPSKKAPK